MIALLIFSCSTATPPTAVESSREPFDETLTVQIPSGCEHLIVDVLPKDSTGVVVACFDRFSRETFSRRYDDAPRRHGRRS